MFTSIKDYDDYDDNEKDLIAKYLDHWAQYIRSGDEFYRLLATVYEELLYAYRIKKAQQ